MMLPITRSRRIENTYIKAFPLIKHFRGLSLMIRPAFEVISYALPALILLV